MRYRVLAPKPVEFVNVSLKGNATLGASTTQDGKFRVDNVPVGDYVLRVSSVGYTPVTQSITVHSDQGTFVEIRLLNYLGYLSGCGKQ